MLTFICPHCQNTLKINPEHVGLRGKCNRCGGRIALIGHRDAQRPQMASRIGDEPEEDTRPATPAQRAAVLRMGADAATAAQLTRAEVGPVFDDLRRARNASLPATPAQLDYLRRLGLPDAQLAEVSTREEASRLITEWLPPPTPSQKAYLARLGATEGQIAALKTKSDAAELIQRFLSGA